MRYCKRVLANTIFFWVLPVMYAVFTAVFIAIARSEGERGSARKGAAAFGIGVLAIILDTQRSYFPPWFFTIAVPLHWLVVIYTADAFLARHGDKIPRRPMWALFAAGLAINLWATFIVNSVEVRVPNATIIAIGLITLALPRFFRSNMAVLDRLIAGAMAATWLCYIGRFALYFLLDQSSEYARQSEWSQYMMMFYFTTGIIAIAIAILLILAVTSDIAARHHAASTIDPLTGIANRRGYDRMIERQCSDTSPIEAVMMIDLDRFKVINDSFGHAAGDAVLKAAAETLQKGCSNFGEIARLGGEEFAILVYAPHGQAALQLADLLRMSIASTRPIVLPPNAKFTASFGVATVATGESVSDAIRRADIALYAAKKKGRNRVELSPDPVISTSFSLVS
jgi:diguanylate cyclase (GGDEF)-like protein